MLQHNLLILFRNFKRFKSTFFINLIGLSTGLACTLLIYLWVNDELNVDKFHEKDNRLFQVMENAKEADGIKTKPSTPDLLGETMIKEIPEIEYAVSVTPYKWFGKFTLVANEINTKGSDNM
jgi:putative ABC transport system permease protein